jgi:hypothetical protein
LRVVRIQTNKFISSNDYTGRWDCNYMHHTIPTVLSYPVLCSTLFYIATLFYIPLLHTREIDWHSHQLGDSPRDPT